MSRRLDIYEGNNLYFHLLQSELRLVKIGYEISQKVRNLASHFSRTAVLHKLISQHGEMLGT